MPSARDVSASSARFQEWAAVDALQVQPPLFVGIGLAEAAEELASEDLLIVSIMQHLLDTVPENIRILKGLRFGIGTIPDVGEVGLLMASFTNPTGEVYNWKGLSYWHEIEIKISATWISHISPK